MDNIKVEIQADPVNFQSLVDTFFSSSSNSPIQIELWKWCVFAMSAKGLSCFDLESNEFDDFSIKLSELLLASYQWANSKKMADSSHKKGGDNA